MVSQANIARRIGRTRQLVHQFITVLAAPAIFRLRRAKLPIGAPLWYWCEVAYWLLQNNMIKENAFRDAREIAAINVILEMNYHHRFEPELVK